MDYLILSLSKIILSLSTIRSLSRVKYKLIYRKLILIHKQNARKPSNVLMLTKIKSAVRGRISDTTIDLTEQESSCT